MNPHLYAVITGDIRKSTQLQPTDLARLPAVLKKIFGDYNLVLNKNDQHLRYSIFRGDSFQLLLDPYYALEASLFIRAGLRIAYPATVARAVDCRLAIAIDTIENLSENITESSGEAFTRSGRLLETMKKSVMMAIETPSPAMTGELNTELALCDEIVKNWTSAQASIIPGLLNNRLQVSLAMEKGISQAAIAKKTQKAGWPAIELLLIRYRFLCEST